MTEKTSSRTALVANARPSVAPGFVRSVTNAPSRISLTLSGRSGTAAGAAATRVAGGGAAATRLGASSDPGAAQPANPVPGGEPGATDPDANTGGDGYGPGTGPPTAMRTPSSGRSATS